MKPTQQEIIDLARESRLMSHIPFPSDSLVVDALNRFASLLLERFGAGAGGGEPVAWAESDEDGEIVWNKESCFSDDPDWLDNPMPLYTHPSPTDLRAAYYEGFMASGEGWNGEYPFRDGGKDPRLDGFWCQTRDNAIEALKGRQ